MEEPEDKNEKEKVKKNRFPDPQLRTFEQSEAQRIFNRFSPCIPPDTTSRQQVCFVHGKNVSNNVLLRTMFNIVNKFTVAKP